MYEDDLSDILPRLPNRQTALPSFNDEHDDPFKNPFGGESDPWAAYGQSSAGAFDDWNTNAFADEPSRGQITSHQEEAPASPEALRSPQGQEDVFQSTLDKAEEPNELPTGATEATASAHATPTTEKAALLDPLDAAHTNVEEEPEHIPVFKRKLPLVMGDRPAESSPAATTAVERKEEHTEAVHDEQAGKAPTVTKGFPSQATPTQDETVHTVNHHDATTPTLSAADSFTVPSELPPSVTVPSPNLAEVPSTSPSNVSLSGDNQTTPPHASSREPSMSDIEGKNALNKVAISPLERTPNLLPNPLDRNFSAASGLVEVGGWGDSWNAGTGATPYGIGAHAESHTRPEPSPVTAEGYSTVKEPEEEEDPEDNVPLAQSLSKPPGPVNMYVITVGDPQKVGDPISAHIIYTVHTRTTNTNYKKSQFSVLRRYSDFVWLYDTLCANNPGVIVPPIPEKNSLGRFQDAFVEARRLALNKCLQKMANHPGLCNDKDLQLFLESDNFTLDIKHRRAEEGGGLLSLLSTSIASTKFYETDEWFETKRVYLDGLENQLKGLVRSMEAVARQRTEFSQSLSELAETLEALSTCDISMQLSSIFTHLAALQRKAKELQDDQAQQDMVTFVGTVEEYGRMIGSVRLAFASRVKCFGQWQNAENDVRRVKVNHEKAKKQSKTPERLHYHMQEVADAERKAVHAKSEFERVTKLVKIELHRFDMERVEDFKRSLEAFLEGMITRQKELVHTWEVYQSTLLQKSEKNPSHNGSETNEETNTVTLAA